MDSRRREAAGELNDSSWWTRGAIAAALSLMPVLCWSAGGSNDTGLTDCIAGDFRSAVACPATGQDGEYGRDVTAPRASDGVAGFSYVKVCNNGQTAKKNAAPDECSTTAVRGTGPLNWGCTLDKVTGITWELKSSADSSSTWDYRTTFNYFLANTSFVGRLSNSRVCGFDDWRLPTPSELQSIVHYGVVGNTPHIDQDWLGLDVNGDHWTSAVLASDPDNQAWRVGFDRGELRAGPRSDFVYARAMRIDSRFVRQGNEVKDSATGLIWRRCPLGQTVVNNLCSGRLFPSNWGVSLQQAVAEATATGLPWRLPNAKELASLIDQGRASPAVDPIAFPFGSSLLAWSATHVPVTPGLSVTEVLAMDFSTGTLQAQAWQTGRAVLLVRAP